MGAAEVAEKVFPRPHVRRQKQAALSKGSSQLQPLATQELKRYGLFMFHLIQILPRDEQAPPVGYLIPN